MKTLFSLLCFSFVAVAAPLVAEIKPPPPSEELWQEEAKKEALQENNFGRLFMRMMILLGITIVLLVGGSWASKKLMQTRLLESNKTSQIQILEKRVLSNKSQLLLVQVDETKLLIAESPSGISVLKEIQNVV